MKLSDFKPLARTNNLVLAEVTVTESPGLLWWKRTTQRRKIARPVNSAFWYFIDTGDYCPGCQAEHAERAYDARQELEAAP